MLAVRRVRHEKRGFYDPPEDFQPPTAAENVRMKYFYWTMSVLIVGTFVPSVFFLLVYAATGRFEPKRRAQTFWNVSRVFALLGANILVWGHVVVGLWQIWFH